MRFAWSSNLAPSDPLEFGACLHMDTTMILELTDGLDVQCLVPVMDDGIAVPYAVMFKELFVDGTKWS